MNEKTMEYRQKITDAFVKSLEEKQFEWKKCWNSMASRPVNFTNDSNYRGINRAWLSFITVEKKYGDSRWGTFNQINNKGWKLQKGAKGENVEYWMPYDKKNKSALTWDQFYLMKLKHGESEDIGFIAKYFTVFNGDFIEGLPPLETKQKIHIKVDKLINNLSANMKVEILNDGRGQAYYKKSEDKIYLPEPKSFNSDYGYNSVALHELSHATGAEHRLNRNLGNLFGSEDYAYEELIAEISACFSCTNLNVQQDQSNMENHKAYIQSWIEKIKDKPNVLIKAISEAEKIADYMEYKAGLMQEKEYTKTLKKNIEIKNETDQPIDKIRYCNKNVTLDL